MDIEDAALMYQGWGDQMLYDQQVLRKVTLLICEIINKSAGGKGIIKQTSKIWPLPGDKEGELKNMDRKLDMLKKFKELDLAKGIKHGKRRA